VRIGRKAKNERKGERRTQDPNDLSGKFQARVEHLQAFGANTTATVATASLLPKFATIVIDAFIEKLGNNIHVEVASNNQKEGKDVMMIDRSKALTRTPFTS
jgi:hypothetical protein